MLTDKLRIEHMPSGECRRWRFAAAKEIEMLQGLNVALQTALAKVTAAHEKTLAALEIAERRLSAQYEANTSQQAALRDAYRQIDERCKPVEVRKNDDGTIDEVFFDNAFVHVEQMSDQHWWIGVTLPSGEEWHLNFYTGHEDDRYIDKRPPKDRRIGLRAERVDIGSSSDESNTS